MATASDDRKDYSVLSVDDEPIVHQMLQIMLAESGLPVMHAGTASGGDEALKLVTELQPDICILDIHMEGMDGLELASRLPGVLEYDPKIIYLTAYDYFDYAQRAIRLGAVEYILKPIRRPELYEALGRVVNQLQSERLQKMEVESLRQSVQSVMPAVVTQNGPATENHSAALIREVRRFIDEHYAENVSLTSTADKFCISSGHLGSLFRSHSGISFRAYLRSVRIARAKDLMRNPLLNIGEIAQSVGYEDANYFSEAFLSETGVRPSEYRGSGRKWAK